MSGLLAVQNGVHIPANLDCRVRVGMSRQRFVQKSLHTITLIKKTQYQTINLTRTFLAWVLSEMLATPHSHQAKLYIMISSFL